MSAREEAELLWRFSNPRTSVARTLMRHNELLRPDMG